MEGSKEGIFNEKKKKHVNHSNAQWIACESLRMWGWGRCVAWIKHISFPNAYIYQCFIM